MHPQFLVHVPEHLHSAPALASTGFDASEIMDLSCQKRATGWSCEAGNRSLLVEPRWDWAAFCKGWNPCPGSEAEGSVLSLWHWEFWPSLLWLEAVTILSAWSPVIKQTEEMIFSTQSSLEKNKSLLFIFKNRMKFGALTSENPCTSTTGWCLQSQSLTNSFVGFGAAADIRWESCQAPAPSQRLMPYKLACFHKPCWEPHHAFVPVLLIITYDSDAYQGADDMQDKQQGFSKAVKCRIFPKYLN